MHEVATNFHFSRLFRGDTQAESLARHEHYLFAHLDLRPNMRILEVGCGLGSVAMELAEFADVFVVGVDTESWKIERAEKAARERNLSERVTFIRSDYSNLRSIFQESSFDGIYCIESLRYLSSFGSIYQDLFILLRPGCKLAIYEWCWTQEMKPNDRNHQALAELLEISTGIGSRPISERSFDTALKALRACRFRVEHQEDLSKITSCAMVPWYSLLDSAFSNTRIHWPSTANEEGNFGRLTKNAAVVLSKAGHLQLFTPMAFFVAKREVV